MWCFVLGCLSLLYFQNIKAEGVYEFPGRFNDNTRRSYAVYPSNPDYGSVYPNNNGNRRIYQSSVTRVVYPSYSASGGGISSGGAYPNYGVRRVIYPTDVVGYPNGISSGAQSFNTARRSYPSYVATGVLNQNNGASGANYPVNSAVGLPFRNSNGAGIIVNPNVAPGNAYPNNGAVGTPYQSNSRTGIVNPNGSPAVAYPNNGVSGTSYQSNSGSAAVNPNIATGTGYPNTGSVGTQQHQTNSGTGVGFPNIAAGSVSSNTNTVGGTYPNSGTKIAESTTPSTNTLGTNPNSGGVLTYTPASVQRQKVQLDIYYETNCPDSKRFITDQLTPVYRDFKDILEVRLFPFGKGQALFDANSKKYQFQCHHGPAECYGNTVQGCSMSLYPDIETHLNFIDCMESYPRPSDNGQKCARRLSLDWKSISKCADGEEGQRILYSNAEITKALQPPVYFVPWINVNKVHTNEIQRRSLRDLRSVVCEAHKAPHPKC